MKSSRTMFLAKSGFHEALPIKVAAPTPVLGSPMSTCQFRLTLRQTRTADQA